MKIWITGYVGSGKSTITKRLKNVFEFDMIEIELKNKGYNLKNISNKVYKKLVRKEINKIDAKYIEGIQAVDYYQKGDKVYFVKNNFITSMKQSIKRDSTKRFWLNFIDNIKLFFKLRILYIKVLINGDIINKLD